jgi:hypothetical protein
MSQTTLDLSVSVPNQFKNVKTMHKTLGTSDTGISYASGVWNTLMFEQASEQITYLMKIMQHVFVFMVRKELITLNTNGQTETVTRYIKVTDCELDLLQNATEETVYAINRPKSFNDIPSVLMVSLDASTPLYLGIEFSGDGKRVFGHSEQTVQQLLQNKSVGTNINFSSYISKLDNFRDRSEIAVPVSFRFGELHNGNKYLVDERESTIRENPVAVTISLPLAFHCEDNYVGFSPLKYIAPLSSS